MSLGEGLPVAARRWAVVATWVGTLMASMDSNIANVALPAIAKDLHTTAAASIWVVNAYQLAVTMALLSFAALGDIFGYTRVYQCAMALFIVASLFCALAHSLPALIAARFLQGIAGAGQMATGTPINRTLYPPSQLGRAISNSALAVALSAAAGPTVAGAILAFGPWQWLFLINVPIGLIALGLGIRYLPRTAGTGHRFDVRSAVGSAFTFGLLVITIDGFGHGTSRTISLLELAGFLVAATLFIRRQRALAVPMLALDLFKRPVFSLSVTASVTSFVALGAVLVTIPFYFQDVLGFSPVHTGLLMTPWPLTVLLLAKPAGRLADRYPAGLVSTLGMVLLAAGLIALLFLPAAPTTLDVTWRMVLCGLGVGLFQSPNNRTMMGSAPLERSGAVSGILAMARTTGQAAGAALVALIFGLLERATGLHASPRGVSTALVLAIAFTIVAGISSSLRLAEFGRPEQPA